MFTLIGPGMVDDGSVQEGKSACGLSKRLQSNLKHSGTNVFETQIDIVGHPESMFADPLGYDPPTQMEMKMRSHKSNWEIDFQIPQTNMKMFC